MASMKLEKWALVAEIASGVAVVVTLAFLIVGINENTATTRVSVYSDLMDGINELEMEIIRNPEVRRYWNAFANESTDELDTGENSPIGNIVLMMFRSYEKAYFANRYDVLDDDQWERFDRLICINYERALSAGVTMEQVLTTAFMDFIRTNCADKAE